MQGQSQIQEVKGRDIEFKLDEIIKRLDALTSIVENEIYPDESRFKVSYLKKEAKLDNKIKSGKYKMRIFRNFSDLDRSIR
jgi:hypothetical protein